MAHQVNQPAPHRLATWHDAHALREEGSFVADGHGHEELRGSLDSSRFTLNSSLSSQTLNGMNLSALSNLSAISAIAPPHKRMEHRAQHKKLMELHSIQQQLLSEQASLKQREQALESDKQRQRDGLSAQQQRLAEREQLVRR